MLAPQTTIPQDSNQQSSVYKPNPLTLRLQAAPVYLPRIQVWVEFYPVASGRALVYKLSPIPRWANPMAAPYEEKKS